MQWEMKSQTGYRCKINKVYEKRESAFARFPFPYVKKISSHIKVLHKDAQMFIGECRYEKQIKLLSNSQVLHPCLNLLTISGHFLW